MWSPVTNSPAYGPFVMVGALPLRKFSEACFIEASKAFKDQPISDKGFALGCGSLTLVGGCLGVCLVNAPPGLNQLIRTAKIHLLIRHFNSNLKMIFHQVGDCYSAASPIDTLEMQATVHRIERVNILQTAYCSFNQGGRPFFIVHKSISLLGQPWSLKEALFCFLLSQSKASYDSTSVMNPKKSSRE